MPKENLRKSLDDALTFQRLNETYRAVIRQVINANPEVNDELTIIMITAHNGIGKILVELFKVIEILQERISVFGDGDGVDKRLYAQFTKDGLNDLPDDEEEREEYENPNGDEQPSN